MFAVPEPQQVLPCLLSLSWAPRAWEVSQVDMAMGVSPVGTSQASLVDDVASPVADQESPLPVLDQGPVALSEQEPSKFGQRHLPLSQQGERPL